MYEKNRTTWRMLLYYIQHLKENSWYWIESGFTISLMRCCKTLKFNMVASEVILSVRWEMTFRGQTSNFLLCKRVPSFLYLNFDTLFRSVKARQMSCTMTFHSKSCSCIAECISWSLLLATVAQMNASCSLIRQLPALLLSLTPEEQTMLYGHSLLQN